MENPKATAVGSGKQSYRVHVSFRECTPLLNTITDRCLWYQVWKDVGPEIKAARRTEESFHHS